MWPGPRGGGAAGRIGWPLVCARAGTRGAWELLLRPGLLLCRDHKNAHTRLSCHATDAPDRCGNARVGAPRCTSATALDVPVRKSRKRSCGGHAASAPRTETASALRAIRLLSRTSEGVKRIRPCCLELQPEGTWRKRFPLARRAGQAALAWALALHRRGDHALMQWTGWRTHPPEESAWVHWTGPSGIVDLTSSDAGRPCAPHAGSAGHS